MDELKLTYPEALWAGGERSFYAELLAYQTSLEKMQAGIFDKEDDDDEEEEPYNLSINGNVAVVSIKGPLTNRDSYWNRYMGVTSYNDIRKALVYAANKSEVNAILLDIDSGGGAVNGVADTGELISRIDREVKPVYAITDGTMASAAYWLGSSARKVYASQLSLVGSIGVITTHMEYSKALKEAGIGVTVLRAGQYKALANSMEPLTEAAVKQITAQLEVAYGVFINHVAARRGVTVDQADSTMGQGREFMGRDALAAGLIDGIETFDGVLSSISAAHVDRANVTQSKYGHHMATQSDMKTALTNQQIAAIQAGVPPAQPTQAQPEPTAPEASTENTPEPTAETTPATQPSAALELITKQLADAQSQLIDAKVELQTVKAQLSAAEASQSGMSAIVSASISSMRIALGMSAIDMSAMAPQSLITEHAALTKQFQDKFKAGGVANPSARSDEAERSAAPDPNRMRRLKATTFAPK